VVERSGYSGVFRTPGFGAVAATITQVDGLPVRRSEDIVRMRQVVRERAIGLGFGLVDQTKIITAASELARNALVYGGGGVTPDVIVQDDMLTTSEQQFTKAIAPKSQDFFTVLADYAIELAKTAPPTFTVEPAWVDEFYTRLQAKGVVADRKNYDAAKRYVTRALEQRVAHYALGDSTAKRRDLQYDAPLRRAIDLLEKGTSQRDVFAVAGEPLAAVPPVPKKP